MKIYTHNFNPSSNSGPNKFTRTLFAQLIRTKNVRLVDDQKESDVEFCLIQQQAHKVKPMLLRLDGIWFNSEQDYKQQNAPLLYSYNNADAVVFQSNFNKKLTESWFGPHKNSHVIHNAADLKLIESANKHFWDKRFGVNTDVWCCASSWRPHKRLNENIKYFLEFAPNDTIFAIAGALGMDEAKKIPNDKRIVLMGDLDYMSLLSLYKRSSTFVHLAYLDHCPNVVVDAQAAGCHVICSSTGGTSELIVNGTVMLEEKWDYSPIKLYDPPDIDFSKKIKIEKVAENDNIVKCSEKYYNLLGDL